MPASRRQLAPPRQVVRGHAARARSCSWRSAQSSTARVPWRIRRGRLHISIVTRALIGRLIVWILPRRFICTTSRSSASDRTRRPWFQRSWRGWGVSGLPDPSQSLHAEADGNRTRLRALARTPVFEGMSDARTCLQACDQRLCLRTPSQNVQRLVRPVRLEDLSGGLGRLVRDHLLDQHVTRARP